MTARQVWLILQIVLYQFESVNSNIQPLNLLQVATRVSLDRCIIAAAKRYFIKRFNTVVFSLPIVESNKEDLAPLATDQILLQQLYAENRWSVVMKHFEGRPQGRDIRYYPESYLIQIRSRNEAKVNINYLSKFASWNPHAKFLVVSAKVFDKPEGVALEAFQALFAANTVSIAVMLPDPKNTTNFLVFSWRPGANHTCSPDHLEALLINTCYYGKINQKQTWFPDVLRIKHQRNYGCAVKVSYLESPPFVIQNGQTLDGIEVSLLKMIEEKLDIVMQFEKSNFTDWGTVHEDGRAEGDMKLLQDDQLDIALGAYMKTEPRCTFLDCTRTYYQESFLWCVPHSPLTFGLKAMADYIEIKVWIGHFSLVFILTMLIWYFSFLIAIEMDFLKSFGNTVLYSLCIALGNSCNKLPRSIPVRYFTALLLFLGLYMNTVYTSNFTSMLANPHYIEKYGKLENIFKYDLKTFYSIKKWLLYDENDINSNESINGIPLKSIERKWISAFNTTEILKDVANGGVALCISEINKNYVFNNIKEMRDMERKVYCFKHELNARPINILMRKGFPFMKAIDSLTERIISSGFVEKWKVDVMRHEGKLERIDVAEAIKSSSVRFEHLLPIFLLVAIGHTIALTIFILECFIHRKRSN